MGQHHNLDAAVERAISDVEQPQVRSTLPDEITFRSVVDYIGAYAYRDLPEREVADSSGNLEGAEDCVVDTNNLPEVDCESALPIVDVWS